MAVDVEDFGAPCRSEFRNVAGHARAVINLPQDVIDQYGGGFHRVATVPGLRRAELAAQRTLYPR